MRRSKDRLIVYWKTSPEPDVARYYLYRGEHANFSIAGQKPLAIVQPEKYFLQTYSDNGLQAGRTYFYKVTAEDWAGNRQILSPEASATTPAY